MAGLFNSGFEVVMQVRSDPLWRLLLTHARNDRELTCASPNPWIEDVMWYPTGEFILLPRYSSPVPLPDATVDRWLGLADPPFLGALTLPFAKVTQYRRRLADAAYPSQLNIGYDTAFAPAPAPDDLAKYPPSYHDHWNIALSALAMQAIVDYALGSSATQTTLNLLGPIQMVDLTINEMSGTFGRPMVITGRGTVVTDGDNSTIDRFQAEARFAIDSPGVLSLHVKVTDIEVDWTDEVWPFSDFTAPEEAATAEAIRQAILGGFHVAFGRQNLAFGRQNWQATGDELCEVVTTTGNGDLIGQDVLQEAQFLQIFGTVAASVPGPPSLVVLNNASQEPVDLGHPGVGSPGTPLEFVQPVASACFHQGPAFGTIRLMLENRGAGPLHLCDVGLNGGNDVQGFHASTYQNVPFTLNPGERWPLDLDYFGAPGAPAGRTGRIVCNDPSNFISFIQLKVLSGATTYRVHPSPVEMRFANTPGGGAPRRLSRCRIVSVREDAGSFTVANTGDNPLFLCSGTLNDPNGVFNVTLTPMRIMPGDSASFGVWFFPAQANVDYNATFDIASSEGLITVPLHGFVQALPQLGDNGDWTDLTYDETCVPADALCEIRTIFEPTSDTDVLSVFRVSIDGIPPDGELLFNDRGGTTHVRDNSGRQRREHALEYTPIPDGGGAPGGDPCVVDILGPHPRQVGAYRASVTGRLVRPVAWIDGMGEIGPLAATRGWVYAGTPNGLQVIDWREAKDPRRGIPLTTTKAQALAIAQGMLFAATGGILAAFALGHDGEPPAPLATVELADLATGLAAAHGLVHVAEGRGRIVTFKADRGGFERVGTIEVPGGVHDLGTAHGSVYTAGGDRLSLLSLDDRSRLCLEQTVMLGTPIDQLGRYGRDILASGRFGSRMFAIEHGRELRAVAEYRQLHWSAGFVQDIGHGRLFRRRAGGRLELCLAEVHRVNHTRFKDALDLRYRPERPRRLAST